MAIGAFLPLAIFVVILGGVGLRLMRLWRRTRELPELSLGVGLLLVASALPLSGMGRIPGLALETTGRACFSLGLVAVWLGITCVVLFTYLVFRRGSWRGRLLLAAISVSLAGAVGSMSFQNFTGDSVDAIKDGMRPGTLTVLGAILVGFFWSACESLRYWLSLRRQVALGLADPVVANRLLLWGVASVTSSALICVIVACVLAGMTIVREPAPLVALAAAGCVMSVTWYLTFFAPESYQRWIRERWSRVQPSRVASWS